MRASGQAANPGPLIVNRDLARLLEYIVRQPRARSREP